MPIGAKSLIGSQESLSNSAWLVTSGIVFSTIV